MKAKLAARLREYFSQPQRSGLCSWIANTYPYGSYLNDDLFDLFMENAFDWPNAIKNTYLDGSVHLRACFVPVPTGIKGYFHETGEDNARRNPYRLDLANFIVKKIAREQKKKFVPIEVDFPMLPR
jgi:hypothetical protein